MPFMVATIVSCAGAPSGVSAGDAADNDGRVDRVEPLSWWTGMTTPLQVMFHGEGISSCDVAMAAGTRGVRVKKVHRADSGNYLFVDVEVDASAEPGTYHFIFTPEGGEAFKVPYEIAARREGSRERLSFTTADMIYLLMPDRFADGDPSIDATDDTTEKPDREAFFGRHGGDIRGIIDHLDYIASLGATAVWSTPLLLDDEPSAS
ncbi:MAG: cyclomaltodextrinase N-terminal domain-containing protein, partial [Alistipes sp.]|nr:cyclomaltodextrinase N-terminal domain-containing protein [Alistipes sp.]